ncbi:DUF1330 domain-containing protein [Streptomyces sp. NA02950]|uniref:DUF1330 domain-containing protein n=1 Tax=Streptomyces sp. NA02950 TaxID=2742137 RepID=UPI0015925906|nr:DUF1330 domain-containing protein [Streptomyces sp. NA02950]QKV92876.1 DUF1330 domain-containing protein [Streptomyces sp. NA02950]
MTAYALAHLHAGSSHADVFAYMERIQATMDPFGGRFVIHGAEVEVVEGSWPGHVVLIEFPDRAQVRAWYESPAYQEILPLRTDHIPADLIFVDGVGPDYNAAGTAAKAREAAARG